MSIEEKITKKICDFCYNGDSDDEREVVEYGIALIVETIFKFLLIFLFSIIVGKVWETISFVLVFCSIRGNAGGIHCKTNLGCTLSLFAIYFLSLLFDYVNISNLMATILFCICLVICAIWAPSSTENNPITDKKTRIIKKSLAIGLLLLSYVEYRWSLIGLSKGAMISTYISISVLVLLLEITRNKKNDKGR